MNRLIFTAIPPQCRDFLQGREQKHIPVILPLSTSFLKSTVKSALAAGAGQQKKGNNRTVT
jgi:hypothetical protein